MCQFKLWLVFRFVLPATDIKSVSFLHNLFMAFLLSIKNVADRHNSYCKIFLRVLICLEHFSPLIYVEKVADDLLLAEILQVGDFLECEDILEECVCLLSGLIYVHVCQAIAFGVHKDVSE